MTGMGQSEEDGRGSLAGAEESKTVLSGLNVQSQTCPGQGGLEGWCWLSWCCRKAGPYVPKQGLLALGLCLSSSPGRRGSGSACSPPQELLLPPPPLCTHPSIHPSIPLLLHPFLQTFLHPSLHPSFPSLLHPSHPYPHPSIPPSLCLPHPHSSIGKGWRSGAIFGSVSLATAATTVYGGFSIGAKIFHASY